MVKGILLISPGLRSTGSMSKVVDLVLFMVRMDGIGYQGSWRWRWIGIGIVREVCCRCCVCVCLLPLSTTRDSRHSSLPGVGRVVGALGLLGELRDTWQLTAGNILKDLEGSRRSSRDSRRFYPDWDTGGMIRNEYILQLIISPQINRTTKLKFYNLSS